ncbi:T9SS type A sorting domain-containing protein [Hymenobacter sp. 15J16-1T3B]|uniref:T9SS type A sorting domain-containing protein n=1 Tax=Hymenobacter sp. 15J16-1T3B TaxID=2886941 RepID=UPI001D103A71|nr:T9SS type A sorting domain-containing protein [Hymenobacter sp. 15J16-1T3B]MCC3155870.1 T9SS type A sorting domain-containing protein [Hymenobacter sp. 15J16-1T3B]
MKSVLLALLGLGASLAAEAQWVNQPIGFANPTSLAMHLEPVDANNVWVVNDNINAYVAPQLARTTDGGQTWTVRTLPLRTSQKEYVAGLSAVSPSLAWITTVPSDSVGSRILRTADGGQTWTVQGRGTTFPSADSYASFIHFFSALEGIVIGEPLSAGGSFEVYRTADGGLTWLPVALPATLLNENTSGLQPAVYGNSIWFLTDEGRVFRSTTRGQSWAVSALPLRVESTNIAFRDAQNGLVSVLDENATSHLLFRTTDGGQTWAQVPYIGPLHGLGLGAVPAATASGTAFYVSTGGDLGNGDQGSSYSEDNGQTWLPIESLTNHFSARFAGAAAGWSTGFVPTPTTLLGNGVNKLPLQTVITANRSAARAGWQLAPNPAADGRTALQAPRAFDAAAQVRVRDVAGRLVQQHLWAGTAPLPLDLSAQPAGLYVVEVAGPAGSTYQKVQVR